MTRPYLSWAVAASLLLATPYVAANLAPDDVLLSTADLVIQALDAADAATADLEPEHDDDTLLEASLQPAVLCPDVRPLRQLRGGRT